MSTQNESDMLVRLTELRHQMGTMSTAVDEIKANMKGGRNA